MLNKNNALTTFWMTMSLVLIGIVGYALVSAPDTRNVSFQSNQLRSDMESELASMESRLATQLERLAAMGAIDKNALPDTSNGLDLNGEDLAVLNQQLALLIQQQQMYQQRLDALEQMVAGQQTVDDSYEQLTMADNPLLLNALDSNLSQPYENTQTNNFEPAYYNEVEAEQYAALQIERQVARYDEHLYDEELDEGWSSSIRGQVSKVINENDKLAGVHLEESRCGVTMCKLKLYVDANENVEEAIQLLMMSRPWEGESFVSFEFDGDGEIFFARDGEVLP